MHCCAGSLLLVACRGGQSLAGARVGGFAIPPGWVGGGSAEAVAPPRSSVSGSCAACESTASSFSWVGSAGVTCMGGGAGFLGCMRPAVFRLGEASSFTGGLLRSFASRPALTGAIVAGSSTCPPCGNRGCCSASVRRRASKNSASGSLMRKTTSTWGRPSGPWVREHWWGPTMKGRAMGNNSYCLFWPGRAEARGHCSTSSLNSSRLF